MSETKTGKKNAFHSSIIRRGMEYYIQAEDCHGENYEYQMLAFNSIEHLLTFQVEQIDEKRNLLYDMTGCHPLVDTWEKSWIKEEQLRRIVETILNAVHCVKRYFLYPDNLVLAKENIFVDSHSGEIRFLYMPGYQEDILEQMREILEYLTGRVNSDDMEAVALAWKLHLILREQKVNWKAIEACVRKESEEKDGVYNSINCQMEPSTEEVMKKEQKNWFGIVFIFFLCLEGAILFHIYWYGILEWKRNLLVANTFLLIVDGFLTFWEFQKIQRKQEVEHLLGNPDIRAEVPLEARTNMAYESVENTSLLQNPGKVPRLFFLGFVSQEETSLYHENMNFREERKGCIAEEQKVILIVKTPFVIGKSFEYTDCQLNSSVISRRHAVIHEKNNTYYVEDLSSTNGTFLNHVRLKSGQLHEITDGSILRLANLEFRFAI